MWKVCAKCKVILPMDAFGPAKARKDGLRPYCRECHRKGNAESRARNLEASREASRRWQRNNPEKVVAKKARWDAKNPGRMGSLLVLGERQIQKRHADIGRSGVKIHRLG